MYTKGRWIIDEGVDSIDNMIDCLRESKDWIAVGIEDKDGYAESVAYCHPDNAALVAAAPNMLEALRDIMMMEQKSLLSDLAYQGPDIPKKYRNETLLQYEGYNRCLLEIQKKIKTVIQKAKGGEG